MSETSGFKLPESFELALRALQEQAKAAVMQLDNKLDGAASLKSTALQEAQNKMSIYDFECKIITRELLKSKDKGYTIPTMTADQLSDLLHIKDGMGGYWMWLKETMGKES